MGSGFDKAMTALNTGIGAANQITGGVGGAIGAAQNVMNMGTQLFSGFKDIFGIGQPSPEELAQQKQNIEEERNKMINDEKDDQNRRAQAQQYSQQNAYGNVSWTTDEFGNRKQISTLDDYQQQKKNAAGGMIEGLTSQSAVDDAVKKVYESQMAAYDRNTSKANEEQLRAARERLAQSGFSENSPQYQATMKQITDSQNQARANAMDQATAQGYQYGNQAYQNTLAAYGAMDAFHDPLEQYKEMAGANAYSQSAVQPAWQYGAGREDARANVNLQQQQISNQDQQYYANIAKEVQMQNSGFNFQQGQAERQYGYNKGEEDNRSKNQKERDELMYRENAAEARLQEKWKGEEGRLDRTARDTLAQTVGGQERETQLAAAQNLTRQREAEQARTVENKYTDAMLKQQENEQNSFNQMQQDYLKAKMERDKLMELQGKEFENDEKRRQNDVKIAELNTRMENSWSAAFQRFGSGMAGVGSGVASMGSTIAGAPINFAGWSATGQQAMKDLQKYQVGANQAKFFKVMNQGVKAGNIKPDWWKEYGYAQDPTK
jgi:hypothetical protein